MTASKNDRRPARARPWFLYHGLRREHTMSWEEQLKRCVGDEKSYTLLPPRPPVCLLPASVSAVVAVACYPRTYQAFAGW
jgi:hypothetical protein